MPKIKIEIPEFITHVAKTDNIVAPNKYIKINNQSIYNSAIKHFARAIVMNNLHDYISIYLMKYVGLNILKNVSITYKFYTVINHGSISLRNGKMCYKKPTKNYKPNWDIENLASIWIKAGNDTLVSNNIILDDNVEVLTKVSYEFIKIEDIDKRKIIIEIEY